MHPGRPGRGGEGAGQLQLIFSAKRNGCGLVRLVTVPLILYPVSDCLAVSHAVHEVEAALS